MSSTLDNVKVVSWNINGIKSSIKNNSLEKYIRTEVPDVICLQEIKISGENDFNGTLSLLEDYNYTNVFHYDNTKKGYSGVCIWYRKDKFRIVQVKKNVTEGRIIMCEFDTFVIINVYVPNSGKDLKRLEYRTKIWDVKFTEYLKEVNESCKKTVIVCGDFNVANDDIDLAKPKENKSVAGFTNEERTNFKLCINRLQYIDIWRYLNPTTKQYTYWSNFRNSRERNIGWRIDYFLIHNSYVNCIKTCEIHDTIYGSDHAPIQLVFNTNNR